MATASRRSKMQARSCGHEEEFGWDEGHFPAVAFARFKASPCRACRAATEGGPYRMTQAEYEEVCGRAGELGRATRGDGESPVIRELLAISTKLIAEVGHMRGEIHELRARAAPLIDYSADDANDLDLFENRHPRDPWRPHALVRLEQRYSVRLRPVDLNNLEQTLGSKRARRHADYILLAHHAGGTQVWQVNLVAYLGRELWANCVYAPDAKKVVTFLPPESVDRSGRRVYSTHERNDAERDFIP